MFDDDDVVNDTSNIIDVDIDTAGDAAKVNEAFADDIWADDVENVRVESFESVRAKAKAQAERKTRDYIPPTSTPHEVLPSSSPTRPDFASSLKTTSAKGKDGEKKERKKPVRLSEAMLVGEKGFPALIKDTAGFKPKGKGHEEQDLNRLLSRYQFWTQRMYPKSQFGDTVDRVEKLCRSRLMHSHMTSWRDEKLGLNKPPPQEEEEGTGDAPLASEDAPAAERNDSEAASRASSSPAPPTRPPSSLPPSSPGEFTDRDFEAIIAAGELDAVVPSGSIPKANAPAPEDDEDWQAMEDISDDDDDDESWNQLVNIPDESMPSAAVEKEQRSGVSDASTLATNSPDPDVGMDGDVDMDARTSKELTEQEVPPLYPDELEYV